MRPSITFTVSVPRSMPSSSVSARWWLTIPYSMCAAWQAAIFGSGKPGLTLPPINRLAQALRPAAVVHVLTDGDVLFDWDMRESRLTLA